MYSQFRMRQYQQQAAMTSSPEQLIAKLYDIGISACHTGDRSKLRKVLVQLVASLDFEKGGDLAERLNAIYQFCLFECINGDLKTILEILSGLRDAWREGVIKKQAA